MPNSHVQIKMLDLQLQDVGGAALPFLFFAGEPAALPMVFIHATGFLPWLWQPVFEEFASSGDIWAPYICNYRQCSPEEGLEWVTVAEDLAGFCRSQSIQAPLLVGHSMGGTVATMASILYGLRPCALVLIEPIFLPDEFYRANITVKDHHMASKAIKRTNFWRNEEEAISYLKSRALFNDWDERIARLYIKYGMQKQKTGGLKLTCTPESEAAIFMGGRTYNPWPLLKKITCPVLVVEGEKSENKHLVDIKKIMNLLPSGVHKSVAGAGHLIPMQKPKETAEIIKDFISRIIGVGKER